MMLPRLQALLGRRLPELVRTTTFRLALVHAALFIAFTAGLLAYLYYETAVRLERTAARELSGEFSALSAAYASGGMARLRQSVIERSTARGKYFYLVLDGAGDKLAGDFDRLPVEPPEAGEVVNVRFDYDARTLNGDQTRRQAQGRLSRLAGGGVVMVAFDRSEIGEVGSAVAGVVSRSAIVGLIMSMIGGVVISRSAARRADMLARTTADVMAGDLSRRAPVLGSGDEFDRLSVQLNAMLAKLERLMIASRNAGDAIAHDLRSPLTRLRNRLEGGLKAEGAEAQRASIEQGIADVDGVLETFNAVLRLSRVQGGSSGPFKKQPVSGILVDLADLYGPVCEEAGLQLETEYDTEVEASIDRGLVAQAVANLLDNAIKYTPAPGCVILRCGRRADGDVELAVIDTGPGIPEADRERATQRFVRLEASRSQPGSGLGLSLAEAVAEAHGGRLELSGGDTRSGQPGLRAALVLKG